MAKSVGQEVGLTGSGVESGEEVRSKRNFTEMSRTSHWIGLHDVRQLSSELKAKFIGKRFEEKKVAGDIVREAIIVDTVVGDNFCISNENVVSEGVADQNDDVSVGIIIVSDDGDDDKEVVDNTMAGTYDEIDSVACVDAMEGTLCGNVKAGGNEGSQKVNQTLESQRIQKQENRCICIGVTHECTPGKDVQQASIEGNTQNQLSPVKQSANVGSKIFIPTHKSQRIRNQKACEMVTCEGSTPYAIT